MDVNSVPKIVTRQRRGCDLNPGPSAPESSTLITQLPSHPLQYDSQTMWRRLANTLEMLQHGAYVDIVNAR